MDSLPVLLRSLSLNPPLADSLSLSCEVTPSNQVTRLENGLPVVTPLDTLDEVSVTWENCIVDVKYSSLYLLCAYVNMLNI